MAQCQNCSNGTGFPPKLRTAELSVFSPKQNVCKNSTWDVYLLAKCRDEKTIASLIDIDKLESRVTYKIFFQHLSTESTSFLNKTATVQSLLPYLAGLGEFCVECGADSVLSDLGLAAASG